MRHEATDAEIAEWVDHLRAKVRDGWQPPLEVRLELGLTQQLLDTWRSLPEESDVIAEMEGETP